MLPTGLFLFTCSTSSDFTQHWLTTGSLVSRLLYFACCDGISALRAPVCSRNAMKTKVHAQCRRRRPGAQQEMIEMSVDKEPAGPGASGPQDQPHRRAQPQGECAGDCSSAPRPQGGAAAAHAGTEPAERPGRDCGATRPKNGLQQQQQQQQQQQKAFKRRNSVNVGFKHPGFSKRRRRANSESDPVLPTNFLLGGNIFDPLNLNSLLDEEVNRALNAETPKSSPLPAKSRDPVEILIPKDITDPLNLNCAGGETGLLVSPMKTGGGGRKRHRHRHHGGGGGGGGGVSAQPDPAEPGRAGALREGRGAGAALSSSVPGSAVPQAPAEGAAPGAGLTPVPESPRPYELNTSINCRDEVVQPILPPSAADPSSCASAPPGSAAPPSCPARHRKRRRTSSKSDSSSAATGPGPAAGGRKVTPEKGRAARQQAQTFQTPVGGGAGGMGAPGSASSASCARGGAGTHRRRRQQQQQQQRKFQYGNYNKYYGYRNPGWSEDPRVRVLRPEWFRGKAVLDLGCNTGHLTLTLAKNWQPARVTGLDIDGALVHAARQNVRHYLSELAAEEARQRRREGAAEQERGRDLGQERKQEPDRVQDLDRDQEQDHQHEQELEQDHQQEQKQDHMQDREQEQDREGASLGNQEEEAIQVQQEEKRTGDVAEDSAGSQSRQPAPPAARHPFPISLRICRGPIAAPPVAQPAPSAPGDFPANVTFVQGNYVLPNDELLVSQKPEYDVILCLSMTKWVHLNWGDAGLQRLFKRVYRHLQPGGIFILEPQPWASYGKRKKLTETIYKNYYSIRFKPDQFSSYLTGPEVGFSSYELIGTPKSSSKGFQRPIYLFHKGPSFARK